MEVAELTLEQATILEDECRKRKTHAAQRLVRKEIREPDYPQSEINKNPCQLSGK